MKALRAFIWSRCFLYSSVFFRGSADWKTLFIFVVKVSYSTLRTSQPS
jgi:hypothetical protein